MNDFLKLVFDKYESQITDSIFCFIENDRDLMKAYLDLVAEKGDLQNVNFQISKAIGTRYNVPCKSESERMDSPKSKLIQGYNEKERR